MKMLCIGGTRDGELLNVDIDKIGRHVRAAVPVKFAPYKFETPAAPIEIDFISETYRVESIRGQHRSFRVLLHEELTPDDMLRQLIEHYKPK